MCSIGWKRIKDLATLGHELSMSYAHQDGYLIFKNRDRYAHEEIRNKVIEDEVVVGFGDDTFPGLWFGINKKFGFAILTAWGPRGAAKKDENNFHVVEDALHSSISIYGAVEKYLELSKEKLKGTYNLIFCDPEKAAMVEWAPDKHSVEYLDGELVKTNDFVVLRQYNEKDKHTLRSAARRKNLQYMFPSHESPEEMESLLAFHSEENELANVCRHDYSKTIASVFAYVTKEQIRLFYSLDRSPEERDYGERIIRLR